MYRLRFMLSVVNMVTDMSRGILFSYIGEGLIPYVDYHSSVIGALHSCFSYVSGRALSFSGYLR